MNMIWKDALIMLFGSGLLIQLIKYLTKKGRDKRIIEEHSSHIVNLQLDNVRIKEKISELEQSTSIRLTAIEVELKNLSASLVDISKDVKMILKKNIFN